MKTLATLLLLFPLATACASGPSKSELDAEVKRLCAIDGGIKVYEKVALPADKFVGYKSGNINIPTYEDITPQDNFYYKKFIQYIRQDGIPDSGGIDLLRHHYELYRAKDNKLLGDAISYARRGGDIPGPWHQSNFSCPQPKELNLFERVFFIQKGDEK